MAKKKSNNKIRETYGCMFCNFICLDKEKQVQHFLEKHGKKKPAVESEWPTCDFCKERFRTPEGLDHHLKTNHQSTLI